MKITLREIKGWDEYEHDPGVHTFFDLDNTLVYYKHRDPNDIFTYYWNKYNLQQYVYQGIFYGYYREPYLKMVREFNDDVKNNMTYARMPGFNATWLKNNAIITARGIELKRVTKQLLNTLNYCSNLVYLHMGEIIRFDKTIQFYANFNSNDNCDFKGMMRAGVDPEFPILFCGGANKGDMLLACAYDLFTNPGFINAIFGFNDNKVRVIDDSLSNLQDIATVFNKYVKYDTFGFIDTEIELIHFNYRPKGK